MSRRISGYEREPRDLYQTPAWVTQELLKHVVLHPDILEPACGDGAMERVLIEHGFRVIASDVQPGPRSSGAVEDFLSLSYPILEEMPHIGAIATNPPFKLAEEFAETGLRRMRRCAGQVALLLPTDFDHASSRRHLFGGCPQFARKIMLTRRIRWFEGDPRDKGKGPMGNHAWFVWDWRHHGSPALSYMRAERPVAPRGLEKPSRAAKLRVKSETAPQPSQEAPSDVR